MSRLVELDATGPRKLDESDFDPEQGNVAICRCGLSEEFPFCDGSHRMARTETDGVCYRYVDDDGEVRRRAVEHVATGVEETPAVDEKPNTDSE